MTRRRRAYGLCGCVFDVTDDGAWVITMGCELHGDDFTCEPTSIAMVAAEPHELWSWTCSGRCGRYGSGCIDPLHAAAQHARSHPGTL